MTKHSVQSPKNTGSSDTPVAIFPSDPHEDIPYQEVIQSMVEQEVDRVLHKRYPHLVSVTIYDFMNSNEIYLYRAGLIALTFVFVGGRHFSVIEGIIMIALFWLSGVLFGLVKNRKASVLLYRIARGKSWIGRLLFLLMSAALIYISYWTAVRYNDAADAIQQLLDTIWANIQTLQTITERTQNIGQGIQNAADSVGQGVRDGANSAANRVNSLWE